MSTLKGTLERDKITAMRAAKGMGAEAVDATIRLSTIRSLLTAVTKAETSGKTRASLDDAAVQAVLRKEMKQRLDAATMYADAGETTRATTERAEADIISAYLPQMLDEEATRALVADLIAQTGAEGPKGMGVLMKALAATGRTDVDKALVSSIAREVL